MITRQRSLNTFIQRLEEAKNINYILADKKLSLVLKCAVTSKMLFALMEYCVTNFDYENQKLQILTKNGVNLPLNKKDIIAFGFNLLYEFENKDFDFLNFLKLYFYDSNYDNSYKNFCNQVLSPFGEAVVQVAKDMVQLENENDLVSAVQVETLNELKQNENKTIKDNGLNNKDKTNSNLENSQDNKKIYHNCYFDIQKILISERGVITNSKLKHYDKENLLFLLNAFKDVLFSCNNEDIRLKFISYKYALMNFKKLDSEVDDVERMLKFLKIV